MDEKVKEELKKVFLKENKIIKNAVIQRNMNSINDITLRNNLEGLEQYIKTINNIFENKKLYDKKEFMVWLETAILISDNLCENCCELHTSITNFFNKGEEE